MFDNMGEPVGAASDDGKTPKNCCFDDRYPGKFYAMDRPDTEKGCYIAARARISCDLKSFTYALHPNDHTSGGASDGPHRRPTSRSATRASACCSRAVALTAVAETLLIVTEDDPQDGGDHIDAHRTPLLMASPWIRHGYVSKGHYDASSIHKAHRAHLRQTYPNEAVTRASIPFDAFSSTPITFFRPSPPQPPARLQRRRHQGFDRGPPCPSGNLSQPDQAPGLQKTGWELMHEGAPPPRRSRTTMMIEADRRRSADRAEGQSCAAILAELN